jgi:O-antigen ligase
MFLTHSRGALLALGAMGMVAGRRRIGTLPALLLTGGFIVGAMALHFTGGRDISAETGADRTALWSEGLQLLKSHPLFGVGAGNMPNLTESHHTAHNSVVVCAAEMGLVGLYFWSLFLFSTVRDALTIASSKNVSEGAPTIAEETLFPQVTRAVEEVSKLEVNRMGRLLVLSFTGYLVAGWFLSRAIVMTLFLLGGMVEVVYEMALRRGMVAPRMRLARTLRYAGGLAVVLLLAMYITLRAVNLAH